eukprot:1160404-Pelagomonas_calceolata.AAC.6
MAGDRAKVEKRQLREHAEHLPVESSTPQEVKANPLVMQCAGMPGRLVSIHGGHCALGGRLPRTAPGRRIGEGSDNE